MSEPGNRMLNALPRSEYEVLAPELAPVPLRLGEVHAEPDARFSYVIFPGGGVISSVTVFEDGRVAEAATIGNEGVVGLPVLLGGTEAGTRYMTQVQGHGWQVGAPELQRLLPQLQTLVQLAGRYAIGLIMQLSQTAACNALHPVNERCARWLLTTHDRMHEDRFTLTQEFLSMMLAVHRPTVNVALRTLSHAGLIDHGRGWIAILDRPGLESASCECYGVISERFDRIVYG